MPTLVRLWSAEMPSVSPGATVVAKPAMTPAVVRLSVGIETTDDLVADLRAALDRVV